MLKRCWLPGRGAVKAAGEFVAKEQENARFLGVEAALFIKQKYLNSVKFFL